MKKVIWIQIVLLLMTACSGPVKFGAGGSGHALMPGNISPRLEVFIRPRGVLSLPLGSALLCRLDIPYHDEAREKWLKKSVMGALFQTGLFSTLIDIEEVHDFSGYVEAGVYQYALEHGIEYCIEVSIEKLVSPVGAGEGFCALSMKIRRSHDKVTIYSAYGEATLSPSREHDYIFFTTPYKKAPTVLQGIMGILRAMGHDLST